MGTVLATIPSHVSVESHQFTV